MKPSDQNPLRPPNVKTSTTPLKCFIFITNWALTQNMAYLYHQPSRACPAPEWNNIFYFYNKVSTAGHCWVTVSKGSVKIVRMWHLGPISSTSLRRVFVLKTSYEVRTLKIGFHQTIELANFLLFVVNLRQIFRCRGWHLCLKHYQLST